MQPGFPTPEVEWFKDETQIEPKNRDTRIVIDYDAEEDMHILEITDATLDDRGEYTFVVFNCHGGLSVIVKVMVFKPIGKAPEKKPLLEKKKVKKVTQETTVSSDLAESHEVGTHTEESVAVKDTVTKERKTFGEESATLEASFVTKKVQSHTDESVTVKGAFEEQEVTVSKTATSAEAAFKSEEVQLLSGDSVEISADFSETAVTFEKGSEARMPVSGVEEITTATEGVTTFEEQPEEQTAKEKLLPKRDLEKPLTAGPAPVIEVAPEPVTVEEGEVIRLTCKISGRDLSFAQQWCTGSRCLSCVFVCVLVE